MTRTAVQLTLIAIWLLSFVFCLLVPLTVRQDIPESFPRLLQQAFDTFAPGLATMIGFVYAQRAALSRARRATFADVLAPLLALVYAGAFNVIMAMFALRRLRGDETIALFQTYRPYLAFLVTGVIAFYFGQASRPNSSTA